MHSAKILDAQKPAVFAAGRGIAYGTGSGNPFTLLFRICAEFYRLFNKPE